MGVIGQSVKRVEDQRFITGKGRYTDDITLPNSTFAALVRSPHAHAEINSVDTTAAAAAAGVVAVFTGADLEAAGVGGLPCGWQVDFKNGDTMKEPAHPVLAATKVRHVGDPVAIVIAESREQAADAAELVAVDYEVLDAAVVATQAIEEGAPQLFDDVPNNMPFDWELGDQAATDAALASAAHVTTLEFDNQRLIPNAIEPRCAIGDYDGARDHYTLYTSSQNPHVIRLLMTAFVLGCPSTRCAWCRRMWAAALARKFFTMPKRCSSRGARARLAVRSSGPPAVARHSSPTPTAATTTPRLISASTPMGISLACGSKPSPISARTYRLLRRACPRISTARSCRGYIRLQRSTLMSLASSPTPRQLTPCAARVALRPRTSSSARLSRPLWRRAAIRPNCGAKTSFRPLTALSRKAIRPKWPCSTTAATTGLCSKKALAAIGYDELRAEQAQARAAGNGHHIGIGFSTYIEACGIAPSAVVGALGARAGLFESAGVRVQPTGKVTVFTGSHSHGQGHETTFAQVVADGLGVGIEDVDIIHGDTESVPFGMGTYGSRSLAVGGTAIVKSMDKIKEKGAKIAAHLLEAAEEDLEFAEGNWTVRGTDQSISFGEVSLAAYVPHNFPEGLEPGLEFTSFYDPANFTFPFGAHIAVVEVDAETGVVAVRRYVAVDDVGNIVNPMIVEGQVAGGITHGIGQALFEEAVYDDSGQLISGSYMDYVLPRADDLPSFETDHTVTPCPHNPLGVKALARPARLARRRPLSTP